MTPVAVPITAWRNARYIEEFYFTAPIDDVDAPVDLTGWLGKIQVRLYGAASGSALMTLSPVVSDVEGVWVIEPTGGVVRARADEATLTSLWTALGGVGAREPNRPFKLKYDLVMTPPSGGDEVWLEGDFILQPGVTV